ncbi:N-acetylmuramoyl-L-alanine amidase [Virgibacillus sp. M23]|uniref:N-acetylmuramoyl-L-alanine amidase n=1 Tax=Virgibacillus sp. M23 TaxID=3079030 RepID=UPI002A911303|nr:N-acetylmuramoyl-L-alanine amidase [Virgibacillus sp. M23]MDY7043704.1 N-acetylmuramoyl-L-alanine amidase [Virgibacillus sp. M23]
MSNKIVKKVAWGAGHGINTSGKRTPDGEREWSFNDVVVTEGIKHLESNYDNVKVLRLDDPTGKRDVPLRERTNKANAWGADVYVSSHHNANTGKWGSWTGTETYTYLGNHPSTERLASKVHNRLVKAYNLRDRGLKKANFHVLRETKMNAILTEGGYMDSTIDIKKLRNKEVLKKAGRAIADGIADYLNLERKKNESSSGNSSKVYGKITVKAYHLNVRQQANFSSSIVKVINKGEVYKVYGKKNGMYHLGGNQWVSANSKYVSFRKSIKPVKTERLEVIANSLWVYNKPDWNAKHFTVKKGEVFTIKKILTVNGSKMYQLKSGLYITANKKYVNLI